LCKKVLFLTGLIKLKTLAKLENTICLLCLPTPDEPDVSVADNCTVVGYGRHTDGSGNSLNADEGNRLLVQEPILLFLNLQQQRQRCSR
jgi:hypothetical protein